jgi:superfamily II DNA or RNA helicase
VYALRGYQLAAVEAAQSHRGNALLVLPTGTGKTVLIAELIRQTQGRVIFAAHRSELLDQAERTIWEHTGVLPGRIQGSTHEPGRVTVASVASLHAARRERTPSPDLLVIDEAHHATARTYRDLIAWADCKTVGVTATPYRLDEDDDDSLPESAPDNATPWKLGHIFGQKPAYTYPLIDAVRDGYLVPIRQYGVQTACSLDGVPMRGGEFAASGLAEIDTPERNTLVADAYRRLCHPRKAIVFGATVAHARNMGATLTAMGFRSAAIWGGDSGRDDKIAAYRRRELDAICNCGILTEGFDDPETSAILMARPLASRSLYVQCVGRGLRVAPNKTDCVIVDFLDVGQRHQLATQSALRLAGMPSDVPTEKHDANGRNITEAVAEALQSVEDMKRQIEAMPLAWRSKDITPRWSVEAMGLSGYQPELAWEIKPATKKQLTAIRRFGVDIQRDVNRGEATALLDRLLTLDAEFPDPATAKQLGFMRWKRIPIPDGCTKRQAGALIGKWRAMQ